MTQWSKRVAQRKRAFAGDSAAQVDGEFGVPREIAAMVVDAKDRLGLRVQGILIGDRETIGKLEICSHVFWVRDRRRFGTGAELKENMKSLTAAIFRAP